MSEIQDTISSFLQGLMGDGAPVGGGSYSASEPHKKHIGPKKKKSGVVAKDTPAAIRARREIKAAHTRYHSKATKNKMASGTQHRIKWRHHKNGLGGTWERDTKGTHVYTHNDNRNKSSIHRELLTKKLYEQYANWLAEANKPKDREVGTPSLTAIYAAETPGEGGKCKNCGCKKCKCKGNCK